MKTKMNSLYWRCNTMGLLTEMVENNPKMGILKIPINIFKNLLAQVAQRATELNDPQLNCLMIRLALYENSDKPQSEEFKEMLKYLHEHEKPVTSKKKQILSK